MTKLKIDGFAAIRRAGSDERARDVSDETVELSEGDEIVSDGPIGITVLEE